MFNLVLVWPFLKMVAMLVYMRLTIALCQMVDSFTDSMAF